MKRALSRKNLWENAPSWLRTMLRPMFGLIPQSLLLGGEFRRSLKFVNEAEHWSDDQATAYRLDELKRILTLGYEKTQFYRKAFDLAGFNPREMKAIEDLRKLPTIDKETVRLNLQEMLAENVDHSKVDYASTGGSSGTPLEFYIGSDRSAIEFAYRINAWQRVSFKLGSKLAVLRGKVFPKGKLHEYDAILRSHFLNNFKTSEQELDFYVKKIASAGPIFLHVYPSSVYVLARFLRAKKRSLPNVSGILAGSEMVDPQQRAFVEETFACRYFSWYGHSEKLVMGAECEHSTDYHIYPTYGICELLDNNNEPVTTPGETGQIVGTGFINRIVPFIRYETGDYAEYISAGCEHCGRKHMIIRKIIGRSSKIGLVGKSGAFVSMTALNLHDDAFKNVRQYQYYQDKPGTAILRISPLQDLMDYDISAIRNALKNRLNGEIEIAIEVVRQLPCTEFGKVKIVDQRLDIE